MWLKNEGNGGIYEDRLKDKCVAFAYEKIEDWYFSISGSACDYSGKSLAGWGKKLDGAYKVISYALSEYIKGKYGVVNPGITDCHLTNDTLRYVNIEGGTLLKTNPKRLYNDIKRIKNVQKSQQAKAQNNLKKFYSCCERKILTYIEGGFVNPDYLKQSADNILKHYTFIIRYDPCEKCMPALFGCGNIITGNGHRSIVRNFSCIDK